MAYRILSLDGGGSWAILQIMALKEIYKDKEQGENCNAILNDFDMVVANSGGSLALAAMIEYETLTEVIDIFKDYNKRRIIFNKIGRRRTLIEKIARLFFKIGPKYLTSQKRNGLLQLLPCRGRKNLADIAAILNIKTKIVIMGFDYDRQRATFFRSFKSVNSSSEDSKNKNAKENNVSLVNAVHASSNAPVNYFQEPAIFKYQSYKRRFWDGAVGGYNNPSKVAVVEAVGAGIETEDILLRSLGTGNVMRPIRGQTLHSFQYSFLGAPQNRRNLSNDIKKLSESILSEPPDASSYVAYVMLEGKPKEGEPKKVIRLNPHIQPILKGDRWVLPFNPSNPEETVNKTKFRTLVDLDMDAVEQKDVECIIYLGEQWIKGVVPNQPIRMNRENLTCQIGHKTFREGIKDW